MRNWLLFVALTFGSVGLASNVEAKPPQRDSKPKFNKKKDDHKFKHDDKIKKKKHQGHNGVPELDPASFASATMLVLGGAAVLTGRRRRQFAV